MPRQMEYSSSIKTVPFLYLETVKAAKLKLKGYQDSEIKSMACKDNIFQVQSEARKKQIATTVLKRLKGLEAYLLARVVEGIDSKVIILYAIMKTDKLFFEFMNEVFKDKLLLKEEYLLDSDFRIFFQRKIEQSTKVASWKRYTFYKLKQVYVRILLEAGLVKKEQAKLRLIKPVILPEVTKHLNQFAAVLGVNEA